MDALLGTILPWPGTFAPAGWAFCDGRLLQVRQYQALFSILSTQYGGDGVNDFGVPDLRGRTVLGPNGQAPLTNRALAQKGGTETVAAVGTGTGAVALTAANLPAHSHNATLSLSGLGATTEISVSTGTGGQLAATPGATLASTAAGASGAAIYQVSSAPAVAPVILGGVKTTVSGNGSVTVAPTGGGTPATVSVSVNTPVPTMPPFLVLNYIICLNGIYPTRN
ncbi:phage tail protein [Burkholderia sp. LMU1-1-1.1]|uniref:phage tail protein n=1 Tax=Burkholderia sp. LMU1-1-1.1 TaxID=3135266 RepID=UPI0034429306